MQDFAAIDFETANEQRTSVCSVGVVIVRDGEIVDNYYNPVSYTHLDVYKRQRLDLPVSLSLCSFTISRQA